MKLVITKVEHTCESCKKSLPVGSKALGARDFNETSGGWAIRRYYCIECGLAFLKNLIATLERAL